MWWACLQVLRTSCFVTELQVVDDSLRGRSTRATRKCLANDIINEKCAACYEIRRGRTFHLEQTMVTHLSRKKGMLPVVISVHVSEPDIPLCNHDDLKSKKQLFTLLGAGPYPWGCIRGQRPPNFLFSPIFTVSRKMCFKHNSAPPSNLKTWLRACWRLRATVRCFLLKASVLLQAFEESANWALLSSFCDYSILHVSIFRQPVSTKVKDLNPAPANFCNRKWIPRNNTHLYFCNLIQIKGCKAEDEFCLREIDFL